MLDIKGFVTVFSICFIMVLIYYKYAGEAERMQLG
jgi:hypothetical protein